ncbi:hypothetical protein JTB14_005055 [Gonioctena quinquepunctata]|nr:hypothetical protein JTB14_005055 [Gonioctena quinquepunctata]
MKVYDTEDEKRMLCLSATGPDQSPPGAVTIRPGGGDFFIPPYRLIKGPHNIVSVKSRVQELEQENQSLKEEVENLKQESKKNCIIIFGLDNKRDTLTLENICQQLGVLLKVQVTPRDIYNFYTLRKDPQSPLKIDFVTYWMKTSILKNCKNLKGNNITIIADQTHQQREASKISRRHLTLAKLDTANDCYIKNYKLFVNGKADRRRSGNKNYHKTQQLSCNTKIYQRRE